MYIEEAKIEPAENDIEIVTDGQTPQRPSINKLRRWFTQAVDAATDWRDEAREDYEFVSGKQWEDADIYDFHRQGKPAIVINRIKPLINVLSGYQRLNRYDIEFYPRTSDDTEVCKVRKGITKYVLDACDFDKEESQVFLDAAIGGIGWFEVGYNFDAEVGDGEAYVKSQSPFGMYVDPEARKPDYSDAKYLCRAKWVDKDSLVNIYPEKEDEIENQFAIYDRAERGYEEKTETLWNRQDLKKIRLVECWYKTIEKETFFYLADGTVIPQKQVTVEMFLTGAVVGQKTIPCQRVRVAAFFDRVLLEDMESPYEHGEFPFVPLVCYNYGAGDVPAGFVRDLKDPQREINRRRIQTLHILNSAGNGGGFIEADAMTAEQRRKFQDNANTAGYFAEVRPRALAEGKIKERMTQPPPAGIIAAEGQATADLAAISGINETLMGVDVPTAASGRAIELKQKQAITHIAPMFDNLRNAKKKIAILLWGKRTRKGVIPQYYTDDKVYRVEGETGQQFIRVNQQVIEQDPLGNTIHKVLNDLSVGEFDIVIADTEASTTQRQAQMWGLVDAVSKLGVAGDLVFDIILDLSDLPDKNTIKERWQQRQQAQAQVQQQQMELERIKNEDLRQTITFKDAPLPIQLAMCAKQGLIDPQIAQYAINMMVEQVFPQLAQSMAMQMQSQQQQQAQQQMQEQQMQSMLGGNVGQMQGNGNKLDVPINLPSVRKYVPQSAQTTPAQAEDIMRSMTPAAL